jgi:hypothetical protein
MSRQVLLLILLLLSLSVVAGAAIIQPSEAPAWLMPTNSTPVEKSACTNACQRVRNQCVLGCGGNLTCSQGCSDDNLCCLNACNPFGPQCP